MPQPTIIEALRDRRLLGAARCFHDLTTWEPWLVFLSACYGLPLDDDGVALFCKATGRTTYAPPPGGWPEVVAIVGRQSGKTRVASAVVAFEAAVAPPCRDGEEWALLVAQDQRAALRAGFSYLSALFDASPMLRGRIASATSDTLRLQSGLHVAAYPCRPQSVHGLRARVVVADEVAYFKNSDNYATDTEMLRALRPPLATTGGKCVVISSPYGSSGALWELHRRHFGRDDARHVLVWQASAPTMNPTLPTNYLERMREDDPEAYRSEVLGEFRAGLAQLLDPEAIDSCVRSGHPELPPSGAIDYAAFADPSGGRRAAFTLAIGHTEGHDASRRAVLDLLRAWRPPFNPAGVAGECADLLKHYRVHEVTGDRYGGEWPREQFRAHGVRYVVAEAVKSDLYLFLLASVNGGRVELPDDRDLLRELRGLERRRGPSGRDRVDHSPGSHDDRANAVAGLAHRLLSEPEFEYEAIKF